MIPHDHGIHGIVKLLKDIGEQQGQGEKDQGLKDRSLQHIHLERICPQLPRMRIASLHQWALPFFYLSYRRSLPFELDSTETAALVGAHRGAPPSRLCRGRSENWTVQRCGTGRTMQKTQRWLDGLAR